MSPASSVLALLSVLLTSALPASAPGSLPVLVPIEPPERGEIAAFAASRLADTSDPLVGGGGTVAELLLLQSRFLDSACGFPAACGGPCNAVVLVWREDAPNPFGVDVILDGLLLGSVDALSETELPGINGVNVLSLDSGPHTFTVVDPESGIFAAGAITVLDAQPFSNPSAVASAPAAATETCSLDVTIEGADPVVDFYQITVDGELHGELDGTEAAFTLEQLAAGEHCVGVTAFVSESEVAFYRGCSLESCSTLDDCAGRTRYIPALCNGAASLNISAAIFVFRYLFAGGATPHCVRACECNSDGALNLTDGICILQFLFRGGRPPSGWVDARPTCVEALPGEDCEASHPACA